MNVILLPYFLALATLRGRMIEGESIRLLVTEGVARYIRCPHSLVLGRTWCRISRPMVSRTRGVSVFVLITGPSPLSKWHEFH